MFILIDEASDVTLGNQFVDLRNFIDHQPAPTRIGIGYMRDGSVKTVQELTADHGAAGKALRLPLASAGVMPSPYLSLKDLIKHWPDSANRREVVLISSGIPIHLVDWALRTPTSTPQLKMRSGMG